MELRLPAPSLVVLVGPSGSGKTTWAQDHFRADEIVSSDRLRALVGSGEDDQRASPAAFDILERRIPIYRPTMEDLKSDLETIEHLRKNR